MTGRGGKRGRPPKLPDDEKCHAIARDHVLRMETMDLLGWPYEERRDRSIRELAIKYRLRKRTIASALDKVGVSQIYANNKNFLRGGVAKKNLKALKRMSRQKA